MDREGERKRGIDREGVIERERVMMREGEEGRD